MYYLDLIDLTDTIGLSYSLLDVVYLRMMSVAKTI